MKRNQSTRLLALLLLIVILIPCLIPTALAEETEDYPALPDIFDQTIPTDEEEQSEAQLVSSEEDESLPAFTVAVISFVALGILLGAAFGFRYITTKKEFSKKKK